MTINEHRGLDFPVCAYTAGTLSGVDTDWRVSNVFFGDLDIYGADAPTVLQTLEKAKGGALFGIGAVLFSTICVSVGGFHDWETGRPTDLTSDPWRERGLSVFRKGDFDSLLSKY